MECPLKMKFAGASQIEAITDPNDGRGKKLQNVAYFMKRWRGTAYKFLDLNSNNWNRVAVFCQEQGKPLLLFDNFELKVELFPAKDCREVELPKFSGEAHRRPALIEIDYKLES